MNKVTITPGDPLFDVIKEKLPQAIENLTSQIRNYPGLGRNIKDATKGLPAFVKDLYGSDKKLKDSIAFYLKRLPSKSTDHFKKDQSSKNSMIGFDLLYGDLFREINAVEHIPLELACIHSPNHKVLNQYARKHFGLSLTALNDIAFDNGAASLLPDGKFSSPATDIFYKSGALGNFDAGLALMDRALIDLDSEDADENAVVAGARVIHALDCLFGIKAIRALLPFGRKYSDLVCGQKMPDLLESSGYTTPPSASDSLLAFISILLSSIDNLADKNNRLLTGVLLNEKTVQAVTPSINKYLIIHIAEAVKSLGLEQGEIIDSCDTSSDIVKAIVELGGTVTRASEHGMSCINEFSDFLLKSQTGPKIDHKKINEAIKEGKEELERLIANIEQSGSLDKINKLSASIKELVADKQDDVATSVKNIKDLASKIDARIAALNPSAEEEKAEEDSSEMIAFLESEVTKLEQIIEEQKSDINGLQNTIASLEHKTAEPAPVDQFSCMGSSYMAYQKTIKKQLTLPELFEWTNEYYKGKLIIHENAIKEARAFTDNTKFKLITDRFDRLAGNFYDRVSNGESINDARTCLGNDFCSDLALRVKNSSGILAKRTFNYNGEDVLCSQYLRIGHNFRIYFAPIKTKTGLQFLIGYCGEKMQKS